MVTQVVSHEALDEVIAVVVAGLHTQLEVLTRILAGLDQEIGFELQLQELVGAALVDQDLRR